MKNVNRLVWIMSIVLLSTVFLFSACEQKQNKVKFALITDIHQDLQEDATSRLQVFIDDVKTKTDLDFIVQLGDLSHGDKTDEMVAVWNQYEGKSYHVLGNHDMDHATKAEIVKKQGMPDKFYSYDIGDMHFVVLDVNHVRKEGVLVDYDHGNYYVNDEDRDLISLEQVEWLKQDLAKTDKKTVIFSHQGLDEVWDGCASPNRGLVRAVINEANAGGQKVIACFCGHHHVDAHDVIDGVHYFQMNSASYFWIDSAPIYSKGNRAEYAEPIYAFITIDLDNKTIDVEGKKTTYLPPAPTTADYKDADRALPEIKSRSVKF